MNCPTLKYYKRRMGKLNYNKKIIDLKTVLSKFNCFLSTTNAKQGTSKAEGSPFFFVKDNVVNVSPPHFRKLSWRSRVGICLPG